MADLIGVVLVTFILVGISHAFAARQDEDSQRRG